MIVEKILGIFVLNMKIAIADIGCGTSDLSIIDIADGVFEVIGINGDNHLGGWDLDNAVAPWIIDEFKKEMTEIFDGVKQAIDHIFKLDPGDSDEDEGEDE